MYCALFLSKTLPSRRAVLNLGSGLFIIIFSFVTVLAALIRCTFLGKRLHVQQWLAIAAITVVLVATAGVDQGNATDGGTFDQQRLIGLAATLVATLADAIMYVFSEQVLSCSTSSGKNQASAADLQGEPEMLTHRPDAAELCTLVGLVNLPLALIYVSVFTAAGHWSDYVSEPISHNGCGGTVAIVVALWLLQAAMYWAHYLSFYYTVAGASSVAAGVNKAVQGTTIFTLSHLAYCPSSGPAFLMKPNSVSHA
eukprot:SAG31_NODE_816_length_11865_cov_38.805116_6_plen_254_part_00